MHVGKLRTIIYSPIKKKKKTDQESEKEFQENVFKPKCYQEKL